MSDCSGFHDAAAEWLLERRPIEDMSGERPFFEVERVEGRDALREAH